MTEQNLGFLLDKEKAEESDKDWYLGAKAPLIGIGDFVAGLGCALFAWPRPQNGIYPMVKNRLNHATVMINDNADDYFPIGTIQRGRGDWMNCTSNSPMNDLEIQHNYALQKGLLSNDFVLWLMKKGYINPNTDMFELADAFSSIGSNTTRQGNSQKAPLEYIRKNGVIPKSMLPDDESMTWAQYHDPSRITQEMKDLGKEFLEWEVINYEKVAKKLFYKVIGATRWRIFDSYRDSSDGDFIKQLAPDYIFMGYAYRLIINETGKYKEIKKVEKPPEDKPEEKPKVETPQISWWGRLILLINIILKRK